MSCCCGGDQKDKGEEVQLQPLELFCITHLVIGGSNNQIKSCISHQINTKHG